MVRISLIELGLIHTNKTAANISVTVQKGAFFHADSMCNFQTRSPYVWTYPYTSCLPQYSGSSFQKLRRELHSVFVRGTGLVRMSFCA